MVARLVRDQEVPGSNPGAPMYFFRSNIRDIFMKFNLKKILSNGQIRLGRLFSCHLRSKHAFLLISILAGFTACSKSLCREFSGLSAGGPTGLVLTPNGSLLRSNWYAAGLHRGMVKAAYGLFDVAETGFVLPDLFEQPNSTIWKNQSRIFSKVGFNISDLSHWIPAVAVGFENSYNWRNESIYIAGTWFIPVKKWTVELNGGYGTGRFFREPFGGLGVIPGNLLGNAVKFVAEYSGHQADIGARFALAKSLRLDFVMLLKAVPPASNQSENEWLFRIDKGFLGASRADKAFKTGETVPKAQ